MEGNSDGSDVPVTNAQASENEPLPTPLPPIPLPPTPPSLTPLSPTTPLPILPKLTLILPTPPSLPEIKSPTVKKTRRRHKEVELLRDWVEEDELLLSPLSSPAAPLSPFITPLNAPLPLLPSVLLAPSPSSLVSSIPPAMPLSPALSPMPPSPP